MFRRVFSSPMMAVPVAARFQSQGGNQSFRRPQRGDALLQANRMPPAFDIIKSNEEDIAHGYMMRVQYINTNVVLNYMKQKKSNEDLRKEDDEKEAGTKAAGARTPKGQKYERDGVTTMLLPALYAARVLSVLEGEQEKCDLVHRYSSGTFAQNPAKENHFNLEVKTVVAGKENEPHEWTCEFDPANALMFRRFLVQVLHQNAGF